MVKNSVGGNKTKRMARKNMNSEMNETELRLIVEDGECYAVVKKVLGNGMCLVMCNDGVERLCIIRSKFKGKGKSKNSIEIGKWILIGVRDWEVRTDKSQKCDVLLVYTSEETERLKRKNDINLSHLLQVTKELDKNSDNGFYMMNNDEIEFNNIEDDSSTTNPTSTTTTPNKPINNSSINKNINDFNIDDI
jgi:translation initiation factor 1A